MHKRILTGLLLALILIASSQSIVASVQTSVGMDLYQSIVGVKLNPLAERTWSYTPQSAARVTFASSASGNVRGELSLRLSMPAALDSPDDLIERASVRMRFPSSRITLGKTRLSWGDGVVFNAGSVLQPQVSLQNLSLTASPQLETNSWLASVNIPLGAFSFIEAVAAPRYPFKLEDALLGARWYAEFGTVKLEAGYASYRQGGVRNHVPYGAVQGNFGPDWAMAVSTSIPTEGDIAEATRLATRLSSSLFWMIPAGFGATITVRLEALVRPWASWVGMTSDHDYALMLYAESTYSPEASLGVTVRSIVSPLDASALVMASVGWNALQGVTLTAMASRCLGEPADLFSYTQPLACALGVSLVY